MIVCEEILQPNTKLMQIANAHDLLSPALRSGQRREQQCRQNSKDGDDNQHFNECECKEGIPSFAPPYTPRLSLHAHTQ